jgi:hypothetical protein
MHAIELIAPHLSPPEPPEPPVEGVCCVMGTLEPCIARAHAIKPSFTQLHLLRAPSSPLVHECGAWGWCASALFPRGATAETVRWWRKRLDVARAHVSAGSPNTANGTWRDWNMPVPLLLATELVGWCVGDRRKIARALTRDVRWLGKKRAHGVGRVVGVEVSAIEHDWSCRREGLATRWLPAPAHADGLRLVRPRPPYWSNVGRIACAEIEQGPLAPPEVR